MLNRIRKSKTCPPFCKEKDCYDSYEKRMIGGKHFMVWVSHCNSLERIHKKILNKKLCY